MTGKRGIRSEGKEEKDERGTGRVRSIQDKRGRKGQRREGEAGRVRGIPDVIEGEEEWRRGSAGGTDLLNTSQIISRSHKQVFSDSSRLSARHGMHG